MLKHPYDVLFGPTYMQPMIPRCLNLLPIWTTHCVIDNIWYYSDHVLLMPDKTDYICTFTICDLDILTL